MEVERVRIEPDKSTPSLFSLDGEHADDHTSPIDLTVFPCSPAAAQLLLVRGSSKHSLIRPGEMWEKCRDVGEM
eukprot:1395164-Amorphochlora_amoeboformis.AAC.1